MFLKAVLVDIDGTIMDSQRRKDEFYSLVINVLNRYFRGSYSFSLQKLIERRDLVFHLFPDGRRNDIKIILEEFLRSYELRDDDIAKLINVLMEIYWKNLEKSKPFKDASDFLHQIVGHRLKYILYSDGTSEETNFKLNILPKSFLPKPYFAVVSDCRECSNQNIIPLGRNKTIETYRFLKSQYEVIAMVGDSYDFDIIPAKKAGIQSYNVKKMNFKMILKEILEKLT